MASFPYRAAAGALLCLLSPHFVIHVATAAEPVRAVLFDGRVVAGDLDGQTDQEYLSLRSSAAGVEIASGFGWADIRLVYFSGDTFTATEFRDKAHQFLGLEPVKSGVQPPSAAEPEIDRPLVASVQQPPPRICSVDIEVALARWESLVPTSGLAVTIIPRAIDGSPTAVRGDLDLTLLGMVWPRQDRRSDAGGIRELARIHYILRPEDFSFGRATYKLPFNLLHPELETQIDPYGLVHARLGVNGQGVFEASDAFVRLRPFSPLRDRRQLFHEPRFFPMESTGWPYR
jgi:hypothetical protein